MEAWSVRGGRVLQQFLLHNAQAVRALLSLSENNSKFFDSYHRAQNDVVRYFTEINITKKESDKIMSTMNIVAVGIVAVVAALPASQALADRVVSSRGSIRQLLLMTRGGGG